MYKNLLGREFDQEGLNYWIKEHRSGRQSLDDIRDQFVKSEEFQGRSADEKSAALAGLKQRRAARGQPVGVSRIVEELNKRGIKHSKSGNANQIEYGHFGIGIPGSQEYSRPNKSNRHLRGFPMLGTIGSLIGRGGRPGKRRRGGMGPRGPIGSGTPGRRRPSPRRGGGDRDIVAGGLLRPGGGPVRRPKGEGPRRATGDRSGIEERRRRRHIGKPYEGPRRGGPGRGRPKATDEGYRGQRPPARGIGRGRPKPPRGHGDPAPRIGPGRGTPRPPRRKLSTSEAAIRRFESRRKGRGVGKPTGRKNTGARRVRKSVGRRR